MMTIYPYQLDDGTWVFDDEDHGLVAEAFVLGASEMITALVAQKHIDGAASGFALSFSDRPFKHEQADAVLSRLDTQAMLDALKFASIAEENLAAGTFYAGVVAGRPMTCWLCPSLFYYFNPAPAQLYVSASPV